MKKIFTFFILLFSITIKAQAAYYVDPVGGNNGNPGNAASPFLTLSYAVGVASNGDTIYIGNGTITADGTSGYGITLNKKLTIIGNGPSTIIEAGATPGTADRGVFAIPSSSTYDITIKNLVIQNGYRMGIAPYEGGAICNEGSGRLFLENVSVLHNQSSRGGAISHQIGKLFIKDCYFAYNNGTYGGAIYRGDDSFATDSLVVENSTFYQNNGSYAGGACFLERFHGNVSVFTNCTFYQNSAQYYGGAVRIENANTNSFINCTIANNSVVFTGYASAGGIDKDGGVVCNLLNCIISGNIGRQGFADLKGGFNSLGYNLIGNLAGEGFGTNTGDLANISSGLNLAGYGMNGGPVPTIPLLSCSQAIDAGNASGAPAYPANAINRFGNIDMGAYEYAGPHTDAVPVSAINGDTLVCFPSSGVAYSFKKTIQDPLNTNYTWSISTFAATINGNQSDSLVFVDFSSNNYASTETISVVAHDVCGQSSIPTDFNVLKAETYGNITTTDVSCYGGNNGDAEINPSGSLAPYTYLWGGGETTQAISGLIAGNYSVTVTDAYGCTSSFNEDVFEPAPLSVVLTTSDMLCFTDSCTGMITTSVSGGGWGMQVRTNGGPMYTYSWSNGSTENDIDSLCAGSYTVTVTDMAGCTATATSTITQPAELLLSLTTSNINCYGGNNGQIDANASGGTGALYYYWLSNGQTTATLLSVGPGQYIVSVSDDNGCTIYDTTEVIEPTQMIAGIASTYDVLCAGTSNGAVSTYASGGTPPYTYAWDNSATTDSIGGLDGGNYSVVITDAFGCNQTFSTTVNEPAPLTVTLTTGDVTCYGACDGSAQAIGGGGTQRMMASGNYIYSWSTGSTQNFIDSLCAGPYYLTVTDQNGCTLNDSVLIAEPPALTLSNTLAQINCYGNNNGQIDAIVTGGTGGYTYAWLPNLETSATIVSLSPGQYTVTATDANGCTITDSSTIIEPAPLVATTSKVDVACNASNGSISTSVSGGTMPYSYLWSTLETTDNISGLSVGNYTVIIQDAYNCADTLTESIISLGTNPVIMGIVYIGGSHITAGTVDIYELTASGAYMLQNSVGIDTAGKYYASVPVGQYLVQAKPNVSLYPGSKPTYYGDVFRWDLATVSSASCDSVLTRNINAINLPVLNGIATISGGVYDVTSGKTTAQGDPVPGVDVSLEQNPGSVMMAQTTTDTSGQYQFNNVPVGNYSIHVDIPGLPLVSTYTLDIAPATVSSNNDFYVDSTANIDTMPPVISHVQQIQSQYTNTVKSILKTYPNPFRTFTTLEIGMAEKGKLAIEVYNVLGVKVAVIEAGAIKEKGTYRYDIGSEEEFKPGVYMVKTTVNNNSSLIKIVKE